MLILHWLLPFPRRRGRSSGTGLGWNCLFISEGLDSLLSASSIAKCSPGANPLLSVLHETLLHSYTENNLTNHQQQHEAVMAIEKWNSSHTFSWQRRAKCFISKPDQQSFYSRGPWSPHQKPRVSRGSGSVGQHLSFSRTAHSWRTTAWSSCFYTPKIASLTLKHCVHLGRKGKLRQREVQNNKGTSMLSKSFLVMGTKTLVLMAENKHEFLKSNVLWILPLVSITSVTLPQLSVSPCHATGITSSSSQIRNHKL